MPDVSGKTKASNEANVATATPTAAQRRSTGGLALLLTLGVLTLSLGALVVGASVRDDAAPAAGAQVGAEAPDFSLRDDASRRVTLTEVTQGHPSLLLFTRQDLSPTDADALGDSLVRLPAVRLVAVRPASTPLTLLEQISAELDHRITVLTDPDEAVARQYGVVFPDHANAVAVVISADGRILDRGDIETCTARLSQHL